MGNPNCALAANLEQRWHRCPPPNALPCFAQLQLLASGLLEVALLSSSSVSSELCWVSQESPPLPWVCQDTTGSRAWRAPVSSACPWARPLSVSIRLKKKSFPSLALPTPALGRAPTEDTLGTRAYREGGEPLVCSQSADLILDISGWAVPLHVLGEGY